MKHFSEPKRTKGGVMVKLSWAALETFGEVLAKHLGQRRDRKRKAAAEKRRRGLK